MWLGLESTLWATFTLVQSAIVFVMIRRKLQFEAPWFFGYTVYEVVRSLGLMAVLRLPWFAPHNYAFYFYSYWVLDAIGLALCFVVLHSVFRQLLSDYRTLQRYASAVFAVASVLVLGAAIATTVLSPGTDIRRLIAAILLVERSVLVIQAGLLFFLFMLTYVAALPWRHNLSFGIPLGFGVSAMVELAAISIRTQVGSLGNHVFSLCSILGYDLAVLIWFVYILAPQKKPEDLDQLPFAAETEKWNSALTELLNR